MKNRPLYLLMVVFLVLSLASCGADRTSSVSTDASKVVASSGATVQSILSRMENGNYLNGELLVKFKSGTVRTQSVKAHQALGASVIRSFASVPNLQHVKLPAGLSVKDAVVKYMSDPTVEYAEPNYLRRISSTIPNDNFFDQQWALHNTGKFANGTAGADIKAPEAWDISTGSRSVVIAVLDTGIDLNHHDLVNNIWINPGEIPNNGIDDDMNGFVDDWRGWDFTTCAKFSPSSVTITTPLNGAQEVPPVVTSATGTAVLTVNFVAGALPVGAISGTVTFSGLSSSATAADINMGVAGINGTVIVNLTGGAGGTSGTWTVPAGTVLTTDQLNALQSNGLYVNVHSTSNPNGEIRGQIIFTSNDVNNGTALKCVTPKTQGNDPSDDNGHGTHVSGIIGAVGNNGLGTAGVMWNVQIMPLKMLNADGEGSTGDEIAAIDYAVKMKQPPFNINIKAINASFGGGFFSNSERDAISQAGTAGILFVAAAGNEQTDNDLAPVFPASYSNPKFGGLTNIISVTATDQNDRKAAFAGYGFNSVQVGAPGVYILSTVPNSVFGTDYFFLSGTSMAAPHVTGLVGLLYSFYDGLNNTQFSPFQVRSTVLRYIDPLPTLDSWISNGMQFQNGNRGGRINASSAMSSLLSPTALKAAATPTQITLTWSPNATGDDGYRVERKGPNDADFVDITAGSTLPPKTATFTDSGVSPKNTYQYRVRAFNFLFNPATSTLVETDSFYSNTVSVTTPDNPPPPTSGGGGCSIGARQNTPTAVADLAVLLMPLLIIGILRRRR